ncbi:MAG: enoyl-CoA hydratase/isomerase family protein, partial [Planctomycetota bacterium]
LIYTGQILDAKSALAIGLVDAVAEFDELDETAEAWAVKGPSADREAPEQCPSEDWQAIWDFFGRYSVDDILSGEADAMGNPVLEKAISKMGHKSYHALKLAENLFLEGAHMDLERALELEARDLDKAFLHADGLEGLSAMLERRRPEFQQPAFA